MREMGTNSKPIVRVRNRESVQAHLSKRTMLNTNKPFCDSAALSECNKQALNRFVASSSSILMPKDILKSAWVERNQDYCIIKQTKQLSQHNKVQNYHYIHKLQQIYTANIDKDILDAEKPMFEDKKESFIRNTGTANDLTEGFMIKLPTGNLSGRLNTDEDLPPPRFDNFL